MFGRKKTKPESIKKELRDLNKSLRGIRSQLSRISNNTRTKEQREDEQARILTYLKEEEIGMQKAEVDRVNALMDSIHSLKDTVGDDDCTDEERIRAFREVRDLLNELSFSPKAA